MKKTYKKFKEKTYSLASDGPHSAVAADYVELGVKPTQWGPKEKIKLVYLLDEKDKAGRPIPVSQFFNSNFDPQSSFYKTVIAITGAKPQYDGNGYWDPACLIGLPCEVVTEQQTKPDGRTFSNVVKVRRLPKGGKRVAIPLDWNASQQSMAAESTKPNGGRPAHQVEDSTTEFPTDEA